MMKVQMEKQTASKPAVFYSHALLTNTLRHVITGDSSSGTCENVRSDSRHYYGIVLKALRKGKDPAQVSENNYMKYGIQEGKENVEKMNVCV